jgi:putative IMPACT (imprinted ancient) family translation regulator
LYSFEVQNILVVVVRYYGGTKLGVAGLIQAYKESTREALENAKYLDVFPKKKIVETIDMETYYLKIEWIKKSQYEIVYQDFIEGNVILHYLVEI